MSPGSKEAAGPQPPRCTVSDARSQLYRLVDQVAESHEPVHITGKRASAVLVAEEDWRAIQETLFLCSVPGMRESLLEGAGTPLEECSEDPGW
ncbi:MAG: type II toxin-antitoxin system Phd/YefM family antitoxin [Desulfovibrionaceae bacterium]